MNLIYLLQSMVIHNTKTGNILCDYFISLISISILTFLINNYKFIILYINRYINTFYKNDYFEIIIESHSTIVERGGIKINKLIYSKYFQAITYYIKELKLLDVYSKREPDKNETINNPTFDIFIPDQNKPFLLDSENDIYCYMKMTEDFEDNKDKTELKKKHILRIFTENKNTKMENIENFIENCLIKYQRYKDNKTINEQYYFCYTESLDDGYEALYSEKIFSTNRTFDTVFFEQKEEFIKNFNFFLNNKDWYNKKGIPYHFGLLLHGQPGCGKTSIIKSILNYTRRNAVVIPLNRVKTCGELENIFFQSTINNKNIPTDNRVYIFEDVDCLCDIIKERDSEDEEMIVNIKKEEHKMLNQFELFSKIADDTLKQSNKIDDELNLSCLLNIFDGILEMPGRIIVLTTNYPDKIDKALLRPGRIDMNIEMKKASKTIVYEILASFYDIDINEVILLCNNVIHDYKLTPAQIMNICQCNIFNINKCIMKIKSEET